MGLLCGYFQHPFSVCRMHNSNEKYEQISRYCGFLVSNLGYSGHLLDCFIAHERKLPGFQDLFMVILGSSRANKHLPTRWSYYTFQSFETRKNSKAGNSISSCCHMSVYCRYIDGKRISKDTIYRNQLLVFSLHYYR